MGIVQPQRRILKHLCPKFREMTPHGVNNFCCGGGSGFAIMSPTNFADWREIVSGRMNRPPWETSPEGRALFERARQVGARLGMDLWPAGTGGGSDGNFTAALGVPTLDGLGIVGNDAHALSEWVDLASLPRRAALLAELILELGR